MTFGGDERAVSAVVGAVLLLGILVSALALYQVNVVPDQNHRTEFEHSQAVTADMTELRNEIWNAGSYTQPRSVSIGLGATYETRIAAINPPNPRGTLETRDPGTNITVDGVDEDDEELVAQFEDDGIDTTFVVYSPAYNEYDGPEKVIEHGLVYDEYGDANVTIDDPPLITRNGIHLVAVDGTISERSRSSTSISVEAICRVPVDLEDDGAVVTLPTSSTERWADALADEPDVDVGPGPAPGTVEIDLTDGGQLTVTKVGLDGDGGCEGPLQEADVGVGGPSNPGPPANEDPADFSALGVTHDGPGNSDNVDTVTYDWTANGNVDTTALAVVRSDGSVAQRETATGSDVRSGELTLDGFGNQNDLTIRATTDGPDGGERCQVDGVSGSGSITLGEFDCSPT